MPLTVTIIVSSNLMMAASLCICKTAFYSNFLCLVAILVIENNCASGIGSYEASLNSTILQHNRQKVFP